RKQDYIFCHRDNDEAPRRPRRKVEPITKLDQDQDQQSRTGYLEEYISHHDSNCPTRFFHVFCDRRHPGVRDQVRYSPLLSPSWRNICAVAFSEKQKNKLASIFTELKGRGISSCKNNPKHHFGKILSGGLIKKIIDTSSNLIIA
ncbi:MAG: hypothetical protein JRJ40_08545, partial [Deltaproteobacteria bacterium]|nr:hypothetical protein [Deltaproteobacteria bacterium]